MDALSVQSTLARLVPWEKLSSYPVNLGDDEASLLKSHMVRSLQVFVFIYTL
jgi:hypothetical protein